MEEEKLLRILTNKIIWLVLGLSSSFSIVHAASFEQTKQDVLKEMLHIYEEFERGEHSNSNINDRTKESAAPSSNIVLKIFVSWSMPKVLLQQYLKEAIKYKASLVFKGLPNNSWVELAKKVQDLNTGEGKFAAASMQLDDEAFERFGIESVPSFVVYREPAMLEQQTALPIHDKVVGNIGVSAALRMIAETGELKEEVAKWLD